MADEQVIKLLEEIKDLQKEHLENQKEALQNQKGALRRQKIMMGVYVLFTLALLGFLAWSSWPHAG
jgi:cell division septal protein FtsQ